MGFNRAEQLSYAGRTIPTWSATTSGCLVGINPGLVSAATGLHFRDRSNRFHPGCALPASSPRTS